MTRYEMKGKGGRSENLGELVHNSMGGGGVATIVELAGKSERMQITEQQINSPRTDKK